MSVRQRGWMKALIRFVQLLTELERYPDIKWSRGIPSEMVPYLKGESSSKRPLMATATRLSKLGDEQYGKAATGLVHPSRDRYGA